MKIDEISIVLGQVPVLTTSAVAVFGSELAGKAS